MNRALTLGLFAVTLVVVACATKRLPPGTPAPEYETRSFPPWPAASASAPASASAAPSLGSAPTEGPPAPSAIPMTLPAAPSPGARDE